MKLIPEKCPDGHTEFDWEIFKQAVPNSIAPLLITHPGCAQYCMIASAELEVSIVPQVSASNMIAHVALEIALKRGFNTAESFVRAAGLIRMDAPIDLGGEPAPSPRRQLPDLDLANNLYATESGTVSYNTTWTERISEITGREIIEAIQSTDCDGDGFNDFISNLESAIRTSSDPMGEGDEGDSHSHEQSSSGEEVELSEIRGENKDIIRGYLETHFPAYLMLLDGEDGDELFDSENPDRGTIDEVARRELESISR